MEDFLEKLLGKQKWKSDVGEVGGGGLEFVRTGEFEVREHWINCKLARNQRRGRTLKEFVRTGDCKAMPA